MLADGTKVTQSTAFPKKWCVAFGMLHCMSVRVGAEWIDFRQPRLGRSLWRNELDKLLL